MTYHDTRLNAYAPGHHSWKAHTEHALVFLYGLNHHETRKAMTEADLAAWRALGSKKP